MKRLEFVDVARGVAVVAMVLWHTGDGWLRPGLKAGEGFTLLRFVGGLAAPSFLLLAGLAAALSARIEPEHRLSQLRAGLGRGAEVVIVGYALRLQSWLLDSAAIKSLSTLRAWLPIALGYAALYWAVGKLARDAKRAMFGSLLGIVLVVAGFLQVESVAAGRTQRLLQVDVLQAIGLSLMLLATLQGALHIYARPVLLGLLGVAVALATSFVWAALPGALPVPVAALFGKLEAAKGAPAASLFPLFPWFAYACVGAAVGRAWRASAQANRLELAVLGFGMLGAVLAAISSESQPFVRAAVEQLTALTSFVRVSYRCGLVLTVLAIAHACGEGRASRILSSFGTTSLRIYWAHMLFAYGVLARPVRSQLGYGSWLALVALLLVAMWSLSRLRRRPDRT